MHWTAAASRCLLAGALSVALISPAAAQDISVSFGQGAGLTERAVQLVALITVLSLAPSILVMVTSFTRIVVVLSLLRTALGTATAPPNSVIVSLALFLTVFVMGPAFQRAYDVGIKPLTAGEIDAEQAFERSSEPFREFMLKNVREKDLALFLDLAKQPRPEKPEEVSLRILTPAAARITSARSASSSGSNPRQRSPYICSICSAAARQRFACQLMSARRRSTSRPSRLDPQRAIVPAGERAVLERLGERRQELEAQARELWI